MTAETALALSVLLVGVLVWWVFTLSRRMDRLERHAGLKKPQRPLYDD